MIVIHCKSFPIICYVFSCSVSINTATRANRIELEAEQAAGCCQTVRASINRNYGQHEIH